MIDLAYIREHADEVRRAVAEKAEKADVDAILAHDEERRGILKEAEALRAQRNEVSKQIGIAKKKGSDASAEMQAMREVGDRIKTLEERLGTVEEELRGMLLRVPNIPAPEVQSGPDATANVNMRQWGDIPAFDFKPLPHWEIAEKLRLIDFARGSKIAGAGFMLFTGLGARLERALINFMLDMHTTRHGYTRGLPAVSRQPRLHDRHRPAAQARRGHVPHGPRRPVPHPHGRGAGHQYLPGRDPEPVDLPI